jgi:2-(1,2-epoxy-1,2-dihydrophenyl)acetyl-CoA isomerase
MAHKLTSRQTSHVLVLFGVEEEAKMPTELFEHDYRTIAADFADGVLKLSINRAENLNAINYYVLEELLDALGHAARLDEVRVVALAGVGDRAFSSGDDLRDFARPEGAGPGPEPGYSRTPHQVLEMTVSQLPKPVVALLKGYCLGAGFDLALACDIRLAADNLAMGDQRPMRAISTLVGSSWFLPRIVGLGRASELLMTGRRCDAAESERIGMVNFVWPLAEFDGQADEYCRNLATMPTYCLGTNKTNIRYGLEHPLEESLLAELVRLQINARTPDAAEGRLSFQQRREPAYNGRGPEVV